MDLSSATLSNGQKVDLSSTFGQFVSLNAEGRSVAVGLAYAMARSEDSGGRLSEADVLWQMQRFGLQTGSVTQINAGLNVLERQMSNNFLFQSRNAPQGMKIDQGLLQRSTNILGGSDGQTPTPQFSEGEIITNDGINFFTIKNGQKVPL